MATSEDQRAQLVAKLEKDVEDFVAQLKPKKYEEGWAEDKWEEEMEKHPLFMSKSIEYGDDLPPLVEALQELKYNSDENTPEELAKSYKDDGNHNFILKKYHAAVEAYTKGLEYDCKDHELNAQLYSNRAAAHLHIGHYHEALKDATEAKSLKPGYLKAIHHGAQCCLYLEHFEDCIAWCEEGLKLAPKNPHLEDIKGKAIEEKKVAERNKRKEVAKRKQKKKELTDLLNFIKEQGINFDVSSVDLETLEPEISQMSGYRVHLDDNKCLVWPVLIVYPEYQLTEIILQFHEDSTFYEELSMMFDPNDIPSWDEEQKYKLEALQVYFGLRNDSKLVKVDIHLALKEVLRDERFIIRGGVPLFFVTVKGSRFDEVFRKDKGVST